MSSEARGGQQGGGFHQWALTIGGLVTAAAAVIGVVAVRNSGSTPPPTTISSVATSTTTGAACGPSSIKGSTNSYGDRIFNEPASPKYAEIASNICFDTRAAAEAAGYRSFDSCLPGAPVKGRVFTQGGLEAKWFYLPTTSGYSYVNPEQCFASAEAAQAAGYTAKP